MKELTYQDLLNAKQCLTKAYLTHKRMVFNKYFPSVEDPTDYIVVLPAKAQHIDGSTPSWVVYDEFTEIPFTIKEK